ncbi:MAG: DUF1727 domain-containing protein [Firmicutes bacterium]|nr:DUF1727 domain-containing protein [Bacillota bacterium]
MSKFYPALYAAKLARTGIHVLGRFSHTSGTNFPGVVAMKICPDFLERVAKPETVIAVTGTNGKTTLCNLLSDILEDNGYDVLSNRLGSNLDTGVATTLATGASMGNKARQTVAIFEVDERASLKVYGKVKPTHLVCTQLTRDSNRRNAHPHFIFDIIDQAVPDGTRMILNADDIISSNLKKANPRCYYAIGKQPWDTAEERNLINDMKICPQCASVLEYDYIRCNHIGKVRCPNCGLTSPVPDCLVTALDYEKMEMTVAFGGEQHAYHMISDSIFNLYDEIAAIAFALDFGIKPEALAKTLEHVNIVDSRYKKETVRGVDIVSNMAKGQVAAACSVAFDYVSKQPGEKECVIVIEDAHNAGKSSEPFMYIYDTDFEFLNQPDIVNIVAVGVRSQDLCLRMMLAGIPKERLQHVKTVDEVPACLNLKEGSAVYILYDNYEVAKNERIRELLTEKLNKEGPAHA